MQKYQNSVTNNGGQSVAGARVRVTTLAGAVATIYSDNGVTPTTNPLTTNSQGEFSFYAANGHYTLTTTGPGIKEPDITSDIILYDPSDGLPDYSAPGGAALVGFAATGGIVATTVQSAIEEVDAEKVSLSDLAASGGAGLVWYGGRTVEGKLQDSMSVRDYIDTVIDGVTSNQAGIVAAVAAAYAAGAVLEWPAGTYVSDANIPNFHDVTHIGSGVIKRGADTFTISGKSGTNRLYAAASGGSNSNDGLSAGQPFATIQAAADTWAKYARTSATAFVIDLAAGTYADGAVFDGIRSSQELTVEGKLSGTTPTVIIDGTAGTRTSGLNFNNGVRARVKYIDSKNWNTAAGSNGLVFQNGSIGVIDTCTGSNNANTDVYCAEFSDLTVIGTCTFGSASGCGIRYYRQSTGSVGDGTNTVRLAGSIGQGLQVRDNSYVVCNNGIDLDGNLYGLYVWKHSYCELRNATIRNNTGVGVIADSLSIVATSGGAQTYTANATDTQFRGFSFNQADSTQQVFDGVNKRFAWGALISPAVKYHYVGAIGVSGLGASSGYDQLIDNNGATGTQYLSNGNNINVDFDKKNRLAYVASDTTFRFTLNTVDTYRMKTGSFIPVSDNTKSLGEASFRWSTVYAGTGAINTSDEREKQQIKPIDDAALHAWAKVEYCQFKFNDAVEAKDDGARWHFGLIAQRVKEAFESEGLDAFVYGLLCYDEWPEQAEEIDDDGNVTQAYRSAGNRYGIRYEEALALECAYLRSVIAAR